MNTRDDQLDDRLEEAYIRGGRAAWRMMLGECIREIDPGTALTARAAMLGERHDANAALRRLARGLGLPDDWPETLHLGDVIDKRIARALLSPSGSRRPGDPADGNETAKLKDTSWVCDGCQRTFDGSVWRSGRMCGFGRWIYFCPECVERERRSSYLSAGGECCEEESRRRKFQRVDGDGKWIRCDAEGKSPRSDEKGQGRISAFSTRLTLGGTLLALSRVRAGARGRISIEGLDLDVEVEDVQIGKAPAMQAESAPVWLKLAELISDTPTRKMGVAPVDLEDPETLGDGITSRFLRESLGENFRREADGWCGGPPKHTASCPHCPMVCIKRIRHAHPRFGNEYGR